MWNTNQSRGITANKYTAYQLIIQLYRKLLIRSLTHTNHLYMSIFGNIDKEWDFYLNKLTGVNYIDFGEKAVHLCNPISFTFVRQWK
jgi:hypothetical protein